LIAFFSPYQFDQVCSWLVFYLDFFFSSSFLIWLLLYIGRLRFDCERGPTPMMDGCIHFLRAGKEIQRDSKLVLLGSAAY
jgi:hypothetical protein